MKNNSITQERLLSLLRDSLFPIHSVSTTDMFATVTEKEWQEVFGLSRRHGVTAWAWAGVQKLPKEKRPPRAVALNWALQVEQLERRYHQHCKAAVSLSQCLQSKGLRMVILKGIGLSRLYPVPAHREGGDIDIMVMEDADSPMSHSSTSPYDRVNAFMEERGIEVKGKDNFHHSNFQWEGVEVENHRHYIGGAQTENNFYIQDELMRRMKQYEPVQIEVEEGLLWIPSPKFEELFIPYHTLKHVVGAHVALRSFCDWGLYASRYGSEVSAVREYFHEGLFRRTFDVMTTLMYTWFQIPSFKSVGEKSNESLLDFIQTDVLGRKMDFPEWVPNRLLPFLKRFRSYRLFLQQRRLLHRERIEYKVLGTAYRFLRNPRCYFKG